jgi:hypothetical protein
MFHLMWRVAQHFFDEGQKAKFEFFGMEKETGTEQKVKDKKEKGGKGGKGGREEGRMEREK